MTSPDPSLTEVRDCLVFPLDMIKSYHIVSKIIKDKITETLANPAGRRSFLISRDTKRIHCLGAVVVDALSRTISQYPSPRTRPQVTTESLCFMPGGGAANTVVALVQMGLPAAVFSKVGDDLTGRFILDNLQKRGVDVTGITVAPGEATPFTYVGVHPDGERTFLHTPGVNRTFGPTDIDRDALLHADFLIYQDCWGLPALDGRPAAEILAEARRLGVATCLDECWGFGPNRQVWETMLPHVDYVLLSLDDMRTIYPNMSPEHIATHMLALGAGTVAVKMGSQGSLVVRGGQSLRTSALTAQVLDTTGAGDCWDAGFLAALSRGLDLPEAAKIGHACAAFCVEHVGGAEGIPPFEEVARRAGLA